MLLLLVLLIQPISQRAIIFTSKNVRHFQCFTTNVKKKRNIVEMIVWLDDHCWAILNVIFFELAVDQASSYINRCFILLLKYYIWFAQIMTTTHFFGAELNLLIKVQNIVTTSQIHNKEKRYKKKIQSAHRLHVTLFFFRSKKTCLSLFISWPLSVM